MDPRTLKVKAPNMRRRLVGVALSLGIGAFAVPFGSAQIGPSPGPPLVQVHDGRLQRPMLSAEVSRQATPPGLVPVAAHVVPPAAFGR